jgi:uncharacterized membrane protein (UPF0127 family)
LSGENKNKTGKESSSSFNTKYIFIAVLIIALGYIGYNSYFKKDESSENRHVITDPRERIKNVKEPLFKKEGDLEFVSKDGKTVIRKIDIEVAENDDERMQGLMYRKSMDDNKGMLFIFQREEPQSFWMKNTIMSLDIIYVNSKKEIVKIFKNTVPFSEKSLPSEKPATYVVEVAAGYTDRYGIKDGDLINFHKQ